MQGKIQIRVKLVDSYDGKMSEKWNIVESPYEYNT